MRQNVHVSDLCIPPETSLQIRFLGALFRQIIGIRDAGSRGFLRNLWWQMSNVTGKDLQPVTAPFMRKIVRAIAQNRP